MIPNPFPTIVHFAALSLISAFLLISGSSRGLADSSLDKTGHGDPFATTIRQRYDFSCGAAALATLLIYHYDAAVTEDEVFMEMFDSASRKRVVAEGFSMLDMKRYLDRRGYEATGYEVSLEKLAALELPAVVLLSRDGYRHFVVVKGVSAAEVLVGDPASGLMAVPRELFSDMWNGMIFMIRNDRDVGRRSYNRSSEWAAAVRIPDAAVAMPWVASPGVRLSVEGHSRRGSR